MMASRRPRGQIGDNFANRRGHANQLSISDPSHHVTEAIGTLYGDEDESVSENARPLSFVGGDSHQEQIQTISSGRHLQIPEPSRQPMRPPSDQPPSPNAEKEAFKKPETLSMKPSMKRNSSSDNGPTSPRSPTISLRDVQAESTSQFALTNMDNPNDIAQELSNLQSLRRMSMDVGNIKDPDMPHMALSSMPVIAPSGDDDENDPSRLLWVPASVHPELAPSEFQSFLEKRVNSIRRSSRDSLSPGGGLGRNNSGRSLGSEGSLKRQKSMLSRQVDSGDQSGSSYVDGAERFERQRARQGNHNRELSLDDLVKDPTKTVQKLAQESQAGMDGAEVSHDDVPILPMAPGMGLRRSTRTTYRKGGSLRSGDKALSRRMTNRNAGNIDNDTTNTEVPPVPSAPPGHGLSRVQSEPISENTSRPSPPIRRPQGVVQESPETLAALEGTARSAASAEEPEEQQSTARPSDRPAARTKAPSPEIQDDAYTPSAPHSEQPTQPAIIEPPPRSSRRNMDQNAVSQPQHQYTPKQQHNSNDQPTGASSISTSGPYRTDNLTFIPTLNEEKKSDKKSKKDRDDDASSTKSSGSSAWKWFKSSADDKKKDEGKKSKTKALVERAQDNVRLDVIQTSIDKTAPKGRESFVLDRDAVDSKLQEERKKETNRRSEPKKEKDGNIFSSIFGGSKKKEERDRTSKKSQHLRVPSEPPVMKHLEPDVDYHWTRFPLLEERAIYRMAHIKLANPRRPLLSQVLLSNFMYSYLAIVQAMHPNMNVPVSPQQKRLEEEARRKREEEEYLAQQQMMYDGQDDQGLNEYDFDYHRATTQYSDPSADGSVDYVDDAQIYEDEHGTDHHHQHHHHHHHHHQDYGYDPHDHYDDKDYYQDHDDGDHRRHDRHNDMW